MFADRLAKRPRLTLTILSAIAVLLWLGFATSIPLLDPDESRFAQTSVEMLQSGDPVVPHFEGRPRLVKPPLLHWAQAALFGLLGIESWVARLPSIVASLISLALIAWIARLRFGREAAPWAVAILLTMPLFFAEGVLGTTDALMSVHVLALLAIDLHPEAHAMSHRSLLFGALMGLGFLAKGPVAVILPMLMILAGRTVTGRTLVPTVGDVARAIGAFLVIVLPWGASFLVRIGDSQSLATLKTETWTRFASGTDHVRPMGYYLPALAVAILPWCGMLLAGTVRILTPYQRHASRTGRYALGALAAALVFLSLSKGKQPTYLLPVLPLCCLVIVQEFGQQWKFPGRHRAASFIPTGTSAILAILFGMAGHRFDGSFASPLIATAVLFGLCATLSGWFWFQGRLQRSTATTIATVLAFYAIFGAFALPQLAALRSAAPLVQRYPVLVSGRPVLTYDMKVPSLTFYLRGSIPELIEPGALQDRLAQADRPLIVFDEDDWTRLPDADGSGLRELGAAGKFRLFERSD